METTDIQVEIRFKNGEVNTFTKEGVRIQRNWRTNIYGNILTNPTDIFMTVDANFVENGNFNNDTPLPEKPNPDGSGE